jgi:hypothetical protein
MKLKNRDDAIQAFVDHIIDGMDMNTLITYAKEQLTDHFSSCPDSEVIEQLEQFAEHLVEEHVEPDNENRT